MGLTLAGLRVLVTRSEHQAAPLRDALVERAAEAVCIPTIAIVPPSSFAVLDASIRELDDYDWLVFTSVNGVDHFFARLAALSGRLRAPRPRVAAVGPSTRSALARRGVVADLMPDTFVAEALADALVKSAALEGARILVARAAVGRDVLPEALREAGARVEVVETYRTILPEQSREPLREALAHGIDVAVCTSPSTATNFASLGGEAARRVPVLCTGPVTTDAVRSLGLVVAAELPTYRVDAVVEALEKWRVTDGPC